MAAIVPVVNLEGIKPGELKLDGPDARRHLSRQDHEVERPGDREAQSGREAAAIRRSPSCTAPTARARPSSSPTTFEGEPGVEGEGRRGTRRSNGRPASAARATKASPPTCSGSSGAIGYVEYAYALQNKHDLHQDGRTRTATSWSRTARPSRPRRPTPTGEGARLLPDPDRPAGQGQLADHRRDFILMHKTAGRSRRTPSRCSSSSTGRYAERRARWPRSSIYVPLPDNVVSMIEDTWKTEIKDADGKPIWKASRESAEADRR